jgi:transposase-like protein
LWIRPSHSNKWRSIQKRIKIIDDMENHDIFLFMQPVHTASDSHRTRMTRASQADRRRRMAESVRGGLGVEEVARAEEVTIALVQLSCRQYGVKYKQRDVAAAAARSGQATATQVSTPIQSGSVPGAASG